MKEIFKQVFVSVITLILAWFMLVVIAHLYVHGKKMMLWLAHKLGLKKFDTSETPA